MPSPVVKHHLHVWLQESQLRRARTRSSANKIKWKEMKDKIIKLNREGKKFRNADFERIRTSFLDDITSFLSNEIKDFHHVYGSFDTILPSKSAKEVNILDLDTQAHVRRVTQPRTNLDVAEKVVQAFTQNKTEPKPKKQKVTEEDTAFTVRKKDALGFV